MSLATAVVLLAVLAIAPASAQPCPDCEWKQRGNRREGVIGRQERNVGFTLKSVQYRRPSEASEGPTIRLYFWLPERSTLDEIRVEQPATKYHMEPLTREFASGLGVFPWPRGEVVGPLELAVDSLGARVQAGSVFYPALITTKVRPTETHGYSFVFESDATIDVDCSIERRAENGSLVTVWEDEVYEDGPRIAIEWDGREAGGSAPEGKYVLKIRGQMLGEVDRPIKRSITFWHRPRLE